jgi:glycerol-3-phosphate responsive antiterminator
LGNALKQAKQADAKGKSKLLRVVVLYGHMNEAKDAIKILKDTKKR